MQNHIVQASTERCIRFCCSLDLGASEDPRCYACSTPPTPRHYTFAQTARKWRYCLFFRARKKKHGQLLIDSEVYCFFDYRSLEVMGLAGFRVREGVLRQRTLSYDLASSSKRLINPTHNNSKGYWVTHREPFCIPFHFLVFFRTSSYDTVNVLYLAITTAFLLALSAFHSELKPASLGGEVEHAMACSCWLTGTWFDSCTDDFTMILRYYQKQKKKDKWLSFGGPPSSSSPRPRQCCSWSWGQA